MGVLKVNVGDAVTPDWRSIGCGGSSTEWTTLFTDSFVRSTYGLPLDGDNGWTTAGAWKTGSDFDQGAATLNVTGGVNAEGIVPVLRPDGATAAHRHVVSAEPTQVGSNEMNGAGPVWAYVDTSNYWYAEWNRGSGTPGDNKVHIYKVAAGVKTEIGVSATTFSLGCLISIDHDFISGALTVTADGYNEPLSTVYSGTHVVSVSSGQYGFAARGDGNTVSPAYAVRLFTAQALVPGGTGRLKLWTGSVWVREVCDGDVAGDGTAHPLKINTGTPEAPVWETAACMVPV